MKLSARELEYFSEVDSRQTRRRRDAWTYIVSAFALILLSKTFYPGMGDAAVYGLGMAVAVSYLVHVYFSIRPEDKLVELLRRYINQDPEAVAQLAEATATDDTTDNKGASPTT